MYKNFLFLQKVTYFIIFCSLWQGLSGCMQIACEIDGPDYKLGSNGRSVVFCHWLLKRRIQWIWFLQRYLISFNVIVFVLLLWSRMYFPEPAFSFISFLESIFPSSSLNMIFPSTWIRTLPGSSINRTPFPVSTVLSLWFYLCRNLTSTE